jgi:hypothetical protein
MSAAWRRSVAALFALALVLTATPAAAQPFRALSLGQAARLSRQHGRKNPQLALLAGITRVAGFVVDRAKNDVILVGEAVPGEDPLTIEDLATALRAGPESARPKVSIDFAPDTLRTGQQLVRFEGDIADTSVGNELLASDVVLKKLALGLLDSGLPEVQSYLLRRLEQAAREKHDSSASVRTRFNFQPSWVPGRNDDNDVVLGLDYSVMVQMESMPVPQIAVSGPESETPTAACRPLEALNQPGAGWQGPAAEKFKQDITDRFQLLAARFPELARMAELGRLMQLARDFYGYGVAPKEAMRYWSEEFPLPREASPKQFPLLDACGSWQSPDGAKQTIFLNGGVTLDALQTDLIVSGNLNPFRDIVLGSRPKDTALWWRVPLGTWQIPGYRLRRAPSHIPASAAGSFKEQPGFSMVERHVVQGSAASSVPPPTLRSPPVDTKPPVVHDHLLPQSGPKLAAAAAASYKPPEMPFDPHGLGAQMLHSASNLTGPDLVRGPTDPFGTIQRQLGGVELAATGKAVGDLVRIKAVTWLPEKGQIVLLGGQTLTGPSINDQDLAVALLLVFGPTGGDARFSLDPANPADPDGKWIKAVYEPREAIAGTSFGDALFEADYLLKQYALGTAIDEDGNGSSRHSGVPGFKSMFDLDFENTDKSVGCEKGQRQDNAGSEPQRARFWIEPDRMELRRDGSGIVFEKASMRIKAKKQVADPSSPSGLRDVDAEDPLANKFAALFTSLYDQIAVESPAFERVRELAKAVALAKWLKQQGATVDLEWARQRVAQRHPFPDQISRLGANAVQTRTQHYTEDSKEYVCTRTSAVRLSGGVRMVVTPTISPPAKPAAGVPAGPDLTKAVGAAADKQDGAPDYAVKHRGDTLQAMVLPLTSPGQGAWRETKKLAFNGATYELNDAGKPSRATERDGASMRFEREPSGKLRGAELAGRQGWQVKGQRTAKGTTWTAVSPRGRTIVHQYDSTGYLDRITVDGMQWSRYRFSPDHTKVTIEYADHTERQTVPLKANTVQ